MHQTTPSPSNPPKKRKSDAAFGPAAKKMTLRNNMPPGPKIDLTPMPPPSPTDDPLLLVANSSNNDKCHIADLVQDTNGRDDLNDLGTVPDGAVQEDDKQDKTDSVASMDVLQEHARACSVEDSAKRHGGEQGRDESKDNAEKRPDDEDHSVGSALSDGEKQGREGTADREPEAQLDKDGNEGWEDDSDEAEEEEALAVKIFSSNPVSMPDERAMSTVTWINSKDRNRQDILTVSNHLAIRGFSRMDSQKVSTAERDFFWKDPASQSQSIGATFEQQFTARRIPTNLQLILSFRKQQPLSRLTKYMMA
ncbi:hypothetical protein B0H13DRAFT_1850336 [Mycena leptocephala]|nr:hypothetical protein B0H13DRAFT_1850336 [Mycena leptocephala]